MRIAELDRNIVRCPYCHEKIGSQPITVVSVLDPNFKHKTCKDERGRGTTSVYLEIDNRAVDRKPRKDEILVTKKQRKPRSDAGKKRGKYKARVK